MKTFVETLLLPHIAKYYQGCTLMIAPDPAAWQKSQVSEESPVDVIKRYGFKVVKPRTNKPEMRIEAVEWFLTKQIDDKPGFLLDAKKCPVLYEGFRGRYRWKENRNGDIMITNGKTPQIVKDFVSHVHDALQYACVVHKQNLGLMEREKEVESLPYVAFEPFDAEVGY